jgi:hypothetical protein
MEIYKYQGSSWVQVKMPIITIIKIHGGAWFSYDNVCEISTRITIKDSIRLKFDNIGFRIVYN